MYVCIMYIFRYYVCARCFFSLLVILFIFSLKRYLCFYSYKKFGDIWTHFFSLPMKRGAGRFEFLVVCMYVLYNVYTLELKLPKLAWDITYIYTYNLFSFYIAKRLYIKMSFFRLLYSAVPSHFSSQVVQETSRILLKSVNLNLIMMLTVQCYLNV